MSRKFIIYPNHKVKKPSDDIGYVDRITIQEVVGEDLALAFLQICVHVEPATESTLTTVVADSINAFNVRREELTKLMYYGMRQFARCNLSEEGVVRNTNYAISRQLFAPTPALFGEQNFLDSSESAGSVPFVSSVVAAFESESAQWDFLVDTRGNPAGVIVDHRQFRY